MQMRTWARVPVAIAVFAGVFSLMITTVLANAQVAATDQSKFALMPLPSSITRGEGALIVTPAGGGGSIFTYRYDQTHDTRLEAAVKRALLRLGRTCGGDVMRSAVDHPAPANASLTVSVTRPSEAVQTGNEDASYQLSITP